MRRPEIVRVLVAALLTVSVAANPATSFGSGASRTGSSLYADAPWSPQPDAGGVGVGPLGTEILTMAVEGTGGSVIRAGATAATPIQPGATIGPGDEVRTGPGESVVLRLTDGSQFTMQENSSFQVATSQRDNVTGQYLTELVQRIGRALFEIRTGQQFRIKTSGGGGGVRGTRFATQLDADGTFRVKTFQGIFDVTQGGKTVSVGAGQETTAPPGGVPAPATAFDAATACDSLGLPSTTVYLPNITKTLGGPGGWVTPFIVQNVGTVTTTVEVSFYRFTDGGFVTCRKAPALLPFTSFADVPNNDADLPGDSQFSVVVRSFGAPVIAVVNEHQGLDNPQRAEALSYQGLSSGAKQVSLPYVAKAVDGWLTTFVMQNLGAQPASVSIALASASGATTASLTRQIGPGRSAFVNPSVEPSLPAGEYAATLTSDQPIAVIVNAHNDAPEVAAPKGWSYNGISATGPNVYLPLVARNTDNIGRNSRLLVQNTGTVDATPKLSFTRYGGGAPLTISAPKPVRPGRAWVFDPRSDADGAACPSAGAASCLGEGEWSAVVSGGTFAVVDAIVSDATAMSVSGQLPSGNRAYAPNVTRTLGGPSGWTTPILLQSAGATTASLRWYRFSDGQLVLRQPLAGLTPGAAVRVDPRTVTALADDTQYAVVADADGDLVAVVTELSFSGGDGAMSYSGFSARIDPVPAPTSLALSPARPTVNAASTLQLGALVKDQFDNVLGSERVAWKVEPPTMGTVSPSGAFAANSEWGQAVITATTGSLVATTGLLVQDAKGRDPSAFAAFDQHIQSFMKQLNGPGAAVAVIWAGRLVYTRGYGLADVLAKRPARADSLFRLASMSKQPTAITIMRLVQEGKLDLDAKVFDLLGIPPFLGATGTLPFDARVKQITVRHLLQHNGGWDRDKSGDPITWSLKIAGAMGVTSPPTIRQYVSYMFGQPLDFDPGTRYAYSNLGYDILALVVEKVTRGPYAAYVQSVLANAAVAHAKTPDTRTSAVADGEVTYYPSDTTLYKSIYAEDLGKAVTRPYGAQFSIERTYNGSVGWAFSAVDYARMLAAVETPGDERLLSAASIKEMLARPAPPVWPTGTFYYAKGWEVVDTGTTKYLSHNGALPGTMAGVTGRMDGSGWIVLLNTDGQRGGLDGEAALYKQMFIELNVAMSSVTAWPTWNLFPEHP